MQSRIDPRYEAVVVTGNRDSQKRLPFLRASRSEWIKTRERSGLLMASWVFILMPVNVRQLISIALLLVTVTTTRAREKIFFAATNVWKANINGYSRSSPAMATNGVIYVTSWLGDLHAINADGSKRWDFKCGREAVSSPAIGEDGTIYFGSRNYRIFAMTSEGKKKWEFKTRAWVDASPAIGTNGTIYCGSWDKNFYAINPDGTKKWAFPTGGPIMSSAAIDARGVIYFGSNDKKFYALNPDGTARWKFSVADAVTSSPAIGSEGEIYFSSVDGTLHALNPDGSVRWQLHTGGITPSSPVLGADGTIYISVNQTHCAVGSDGKFKWQRAFWHAQPDLFGESAAAVLADNSVVFIGCDGFVMTVPGDDGKEDWIWNAWMDGPSYSSPLVGPDGKVYVMGIEPFLKCLDRNVPLAATPWPMFRGNPQHTGRVNRVGKNSSPRLSDR